VRTRQRDAYKLPVLLTIALLAACLASPAGTIWSGKGVDGQAESSDPTIAAALLLQDKPAPDGVPSPGSSGTSLSTLTAQAMRLTASDSADGDLFGYSVSADGDTVVVGAPGDDTRQGAAYVFNRNRDGADAWGQAIKLTASDGAVGDALGQSVSISGDVIVVGAPSNASQGAAYIFMRNYDPDNPGPPLADNWGEVAKLTASDGMAADNFGHSVSISGDTAVVGAMGDDASQGAAYIFMRNYDPDNPGTPLADNWGEVAKLTASDGTAVDNFGHSVSISGDTVVVGAVGDDTFQGSAYVFERNHDPSNPGTPLADNWGQVTKLVSDDGAARSLFGWSVSISDDTVVSGAWGAGAFQGAAYVFERNYDPSNPATPLADNWGQVARLLAEDGSTNDNFGQSVCVRGDTVIAGAPGDDTRGSAYRFERNQGGADAWGQMDKIAASADAAWSYFGYSVVFTGRHSVIGAWGDYEGRGAVHVFAHSDLQSEKAHPVASDGATDDNFGTSVSTNGDTLVVGAPRDDNYRGSAYVFARNHGGADSWAQVAKLTALDGATGDRFGSSVAISGDTIVVGAPGDGNYRGSAYTFERNRGGPDGWGQVAKLAASDGVAGDRFGSSVSLDASTAAIGAYRKATNRGAAYVFEHNQGGADAWGEVAKLTASGGQAGDWLGFSVSISGDTVVAGAPYDINGSSATGSAYVFERNQGGVDAWEQVGQLVASDGAAGDSFGFSVSICGSTIATGASYDSAGGALSGSAYVFERNQGGADSWGEVAKLTTSDGAAGGRMGHSISISGDTVVAGAPYEAGSGVPTGSAYVFERNRGGGDNWGQWFKLTPSDGAADDAFGFSVSASGNTVVAGAPYDDGSSGNSSGSAYVFYPPARKVYLPLVLSD
jgi:hypothetical protein